MKAERLGGWGRTARHEPGVPRGPVGSAALDPSQSFRNRPDVLGTLLHVVVDAAAGFE